MPLALAMGSYLRLETADLRLTQDCPYKLEELLEDRFYPGEPSAELESEF